MTASIARCPISTRGRPSRRTGRAIRKAFTLVAVAILAGAAAPRPALAEGSDPKWKLTTDRADFFMYGRMGTGWTPSGQVIAGRYMNLGDRRAIGGRLEEGDYLEPGLRYHMLQGTKETDTMADLVMDVEMWSMDGAILSDLASGALDELKIFPLQAYVQAHNVLVPDLDIWIGARLYRKQDIHIADYFYFNNLPSQGFGAFYKGLDAAVLITTGASPFYQVDMNAGQPAPAKSDMARRLRTMLVAQYALPLGLRSSFAQGLGELHVVPKSAKGDVDAPPNVNPSDYGWVAGAKLHLDLGGENFNSTSIRYGARIANGAASGRSTYDTFGLPALDGTYQGAAGVEFVEHFGVQFGQLLALNGYGTVHWNKGARGHAPLTPDEPPDSRLDYTVGLRPVLYLHPQFHLMAEATFQARKDQGRAQGTATKVSLAPTIVPSGKEGEASVWTRPHYRLIYTYGHYNDGAMTQLMSPYLQTVGPTHTAHFLGVRAEWWFY
ncbi:MAG TPA: carbohydrate porin [Polyangiaceae bacterium]|nr:carbohydrate porin [Polyangiaceae bacterium]